MANKKYARVWRIMRAKAGASYIFIVGTPENEKMTDAQIANLYEKCILLAGDSNDIREEAEAVKRDFGFMGIAACVSVLPGGYVGIDCAAKKSDYPSRGRIYDEDVTGLLLADSIRKVAASAGVEVDPSDQMLHVRSFDFIRQNVNGAETDFSYCFDRVDEPDVPDGCEVVRFTAPFRDPINQYWNRPYHLEPGEYVVYRSDCAEWLEANGYAERGVDVPLRYYINNNSGVTDWDGIKALLQGAMSAAVGRIIVPDCAN